MSFKVKKQYQVIAKLTMVTRRFQWENGVDDNIGSRKVANSLFLLLITGYSKVENSEKVVRFRHCQFKIENVHSRHSCIIKNLLLREFK
ncbi:hypothetical protein F8M41_007136 [Gigaspora margarita]|uniref:Uncharacterized protein n=1 Tax=Gigaspora margarita TaxID=4874 RepID=A0A8H3X667_GIGMA|nr:hypothetical protein F8M41_007136 [Gigaspora margarita]